MTEKHGSPIEALGDDKKRRVQGFGKERIQGVKGSSGERQRVGDRRQETEDRRGLGGWRVGGVAKKLKGEEKQNKSEKP